MVMSLVQAMALKQQLPNFNPHQAVLAHQLDTASPLGAYLQAWPMVSVPHCRYSLGAFQVPGVAQAYAQVAIHAWQVQQPRATVCLAPGLFDHAGLFIPVISHLVQQGFSVLCVEMPGHGLSPGSHCAIDHFPTYGAIWQAVWQAHGAAFPAPWVGLGQSTGCAALMAWQNHPQCPLNLSRLVLVAPLLRPKHWWRVYALTRLAGHFIKQVPRKSPSHSHDAAFNACMQQDVLQAQVIAAPWAKALVAWACGFNQLPVKHTPVLVLQGTQDQVVDWRFNVPALQRHFKELQVAYFQGAYHHLLNEQPEYRRDAYGQLVDFLGQGGKGLNAG